jgi:YggT family protein
MTGIAGITVLFAITRDDVAAYVNSLFIVYLILIFIWVLASWIPRMPYNPVLRAILDFVNQVTVPYLSIFRRILPPIGGGGFALDLSPIVGVIVLLVAQRIVVGLIAG